MNSKTKPDVAGKQTDNTIILSDKTFSEYENKEMIFNAKAKQELTGKSQIAFKNYILRRYGNNISLIQKYQALNFNIIHNKQDNCEKIYI